MAATAMHGREGTLHRPGRAWMAPLLVALALGAPVPPAGSQPVAPPAAAAPAAPALRATAPAAGMRTIRLIGGMTWVSSLEYYRLMNQRVRQRYGDNSSARVLMYSIEFGEFSRNERLAEAGGWGAPCAGSCLMRPAASSVEGPTSS